MANNRVCLTCGKAYEYCSSCASAKNLPVWKNLFDEELCKVAFTCVSDYKQNVITKERVKERLDGYELSDVSNMKDSIKEVINEILQEDATETAEPVVAKKTTTKRVAKKKAVKETASVD